MNSTITPLDSRICDQARRSRDARFDGLFFTAVTSTRIYCRPVCPARTPRRENVVFHPSAASADRGPRAGVIPDRWSKPDPASSASQS